MGGQHAGLCTCRRRPGGYSCHPACRAATERLVQNPEIARWATEMAQRRAAVELGKARRVPDPTIGGGFRHTRETGDNAMVMEFSMPLPVFDRNQGGFLEARYQLAKAEEERRAAEIQGRTALAEAYAALSSAFVEATRLKNEVLPGAQRAFDAASEGYRQGKFGFLDVLDAQRHSVRGERPVSGGAGGLPPGGGRGGTLDRRTTWRASRHAKSRSKTERNDEQ